MINFLTAGTILGLSAGFAPGPLLTLVISETVRYGIKAGLKVAISPILTDLPIILITLFILKKLSAFDAVLGIISFSGAFLLLYMGFESMLVKGVSLNQPDCKPESLKKGMIVNFLSPHPYLFWLSVGAPTVVRAMEQNVFAALAFISSFYILLVGSKISLAILVGKFRYFLTGNFYIYTMRILGLMLFAFAGLLFIDGMKLTGLL